MKEWQPEEAHLLITKILLNTNFAKETDMTREEAEGIAEDIVTALEQAE